MQPIKNELLGMENTSDLTTKDRHDPGSMIFDTLSICRPSVQFGLARREERDIFLTITRESTGEESRTVFVLEILDKT